ncbi:MAG: hypothetical protein JXO22_14075 [Phycisphaerae bacterium]|nr:hypothetical protein [Phycisphaerae bacterium]
MASHKVLFTTLAVAVGFGALALVQAFGPQPPAEHGQAIIGSEREATRPARPPGKIGPPAEIFISLAAGERAGDPVTVNVSASSWVAVGSGAITLTTPEGRDASGETIVLWSSARSGYVDETREFAAGALAKGLHQFTAIFEFTPDDDPDQPMAVSACLYLDVQAEAIFASDVSFEQLKRIELLEELEQRVLAESKPRLAAADRTTKAREIASLKTRDPDFVARRIAQIRATDPDVARRIEELNEAPARTETDPDPAEIAPMAGEATVPSYRLNAQ